MTGNGSEDTLIYENTQETSPMHITEDEDEGGTGSQAEDADQGKTVAFDIPAEMLEHIPVDEMDPNAEIVGINDVTQNGNGMHIPIRAFPPFC